MYTQLLLIVKKIWQPIQWVASTLFILYLYEKFVRKEEKPQKVISNDNSTNVEVGKIKKTSGVNEITAVAKDVVSEIKEKKLPIIDKSKNVKSKVDKLKEKQVKAVAKGKTKKVERIGKRIVKKSVK